MQDHTTSNNKMGKDKNKDKDHNDGETAATSKTNSPWDACQESRRDLSRDQEARDTTIVQTIAEAVAREMKRLMQTTKLFSMREAQQPFKPALRYLQEQMVLRLWTPLIGQRTNLSTRDGNCGQKRLNRTLPKSMSIQEKRQESISCQDSTTSD